ncbi:MAG: TRAP transporter small permease subunit [Bacteroidota bacterium]
MLGALRMLIRFANSINEWIGKSVSWLTTTLVLLVCFDVARRALFDTTAAWIMELEWHLFALIFLLGAGYSLKRDRHVRVDLFYAKFSAKDKALVNLLGTLLFLIPWCILIIYFSYFYALDAYIIGEVSPDPGGLPARYLIKFAITLGISLLLLQAMAMAASSALILMDQQAESDSTSATP